jgi:thiamine-phosphate pyrophosphorylase
MNSDYNQTVVSEDQNARQTTSSGGILRLIDANANRAREAARVMEDYARFVLDDPALSGQLKSLRHELADVLKPTLPAAILFRDTPGDVGTALKSAGEMQRAGLADVVIAAGKRCGEALRALEEFLKTIDSHAASQIETLRYQLYDLERRLALTLRPHRRFDDVRLYVLITESACRHPWLETASAAIDGGADCLQLREPQLTGQELFNRASQLTALCRRRGVISMINDRPDIALAAGADGAHVGQGDLPAQVVRRLIGNEKILGVSTHNLDQARQAVRDGADYIGVGPIFKSATKPRDFVAGLEYAAQAARQIAIAKVGIAGIGPENVDKVLSAGLKAIAVTAAVTGQDDVAAAARMLKQRLLQPGGD